MLQKFFVKRKCSNFKFDEEIEMGNAVHHCDFRLRYSAFYEMLTENIDIQILFMQVIHMDWDEYGPGYKLFHFVNSFHNLQFMVKLQLNLIGLPSSNRNNEWNIQHFSHWSFEHINLKKCESLRLIRMGFKSLEEIDHILSTIFL